MKNLREMNIRKNRKGLFKNYWTTQLILDRENGNTANNIFEEVFGRQG